MKPSFLSAFAGIAMVLGLAMGTREAGAQTPATPAKEVVVAESPLNNRCTVTLDPQFKSAPDLASQNQKNPGFTTANTAEGMLVRMDSEWIVLKEGNSESWIPREKVLLIHVSR